MPGSRPGMTGVVHPLVGRARQPPQNGVSRAVKQTCLGTLSHEKKYQFLFLTNTIHASVLHRRSPSQRPHGQVVKEVPPLKSACARRGTRASRRAASQGGESAVAALPSRSTNFLTTRHNGLAG